FSASVLRYQARARPRVLALASPQCHGSTKNAKSNPPGIVFAAGSACGKSLVCRCSEVLYSCCRRWRLRAGLFSCDLHKRGNLAERFRRLRASCHHLLRLLLLLQYFELLFKLALAKHQVLRSPNLK